MSEKLLTADIGLPAIREAFMFRPIARRESPALESRYGS
jgi:hypothetical protein